MRSQKRRGKQDNFPKRYATALRLYLSDSRGVGLPRARRLGEEAALRGIETLALARIHGEALVTIFSANGETAHAGRSAVFFEEALIPITKRHRGAHNHKLKMGQIEKALRQQTRELAKTNERWKLDATRRKKAEGALKKSEGRYALLLRQSLEVQRDLKKISHRVLAAQESERKDTSQQLQNEIGQTLLAINVQLFSLKQEARSNNEGLKNGIADTQRMVVNSERSVRRAGRDLGKHETKAQ